MAALQMLITDAGLEAIVNAQEGGTDQILIETLGLTATPFVMAPTLTALPGQFRVIDTVSGQAIAENIIHVVAYDPDPITYDVTGFGLYDGDGTLIAVFSAAADPILSKAAPAVSLFAFDVVLSADIAAVIQFGDALFLNPPATRDVIGVVRLATPAQADAGADDSAAMTPAMVQRMIDKALHHKIMLWSGAVADIEAGWQLCDGTGGTPDLRDKFVVGAGGGKAVAATGGSPTHAHTAAVQGHVLTVAEMPAHRHLLAVPGESGTALAAGNSISRQRGPGDGEGYTLNGAPYEPSIGRSSETGGGTAHSHGITINPADHLPPYYALAYIMKV